MDILVIVGYILAVINPVIGGVLVGFIVWLSRPDTGFQIITLSFFVFSLFVVAFIIWGVRKFRKLEETIAQLKGN